MAGPAASRTAPLPGGFERFDHLLVAVLDRQVERGLSPVSPVVRGESAAFSSFVPPQAALIRAGPLAAASVPNVKSLMADPKARARGPEPVADAPVFAETAAEPKARAALRLHAAGERYLAVKPDWPEVYAGEAGALFRWGPAMACVEGGPCDLVPERLPDLVLVQVTLGFSEDDDKGRRWKTPQGTLGYVWHGKTGGWSNAEKVVPLKVVRDGDLPLRVQVMDGAPGLCPR